MNKKLLIILGLIFLSCSLSSCIPYGKGKTIGYITTVESGLLWDRVWIRAELESSQTDSYLVRKFKEEFKNDLIDSSKNKQRIELYYKKHIWCWAVGNSDEAISFQVVK